jgi:hypothetical protein
VIAARVRINGDEADWFGGECRFAALPPIGAEISIVDKNANHRHLTVQRIVVGGLRAGYEPILPGAAENSLAIYLYCSE